MVDSSPRDINLPAPAGVTTIPLTFNPANVFNLVNRNPINSIAPTITRFAPGDNVFGTGVIVPAPTIAPATMTDIQLTQSLQYYVLYNGNLPVMDPARPLRYLFVGSSYIVPVDHKTDKSVTYTVSVHQTIRMERIPTLGYTGELTFDLYDYTVDTTNPVPVNVYTPKTPNLLVPTTNVPVDRLLPPIKVMRTDLTPTRVGHEFELVYPDAHFKSIKGIKAQDAFAPLFVAYSQGVAGICLIGDIDPIKGCTLEKAIRSSAPTVTELPVTPASPPPVPVSLPIAYGKPREVEVMYSTRIFEFSGTDNTFKILKFVSLFQEELRKLPPLLSGLAISSPNQFNIAIDTTIAQSTVTVDGTTIILKSDQLCADELSYLLLLTVVARESNIKGHASPLAYGTSPLNWSNGILIAISKLISNQITGIVPGTPPSLIGGCFTAVGAIDLVTFADNVNIGSFKNTAAATWSLVNSPYPDWSSDSMFKLLFKVKTTDHIQSFADFYNMKRLPPLPILYEKYIIIRPFSAKMDTDDDEPAARHMMSLFTIPTTTTSDIETNQNIVSPLQQLFNFIDQAAFTPDELLQLDNQQINLLKESLDKWVDISSENQGIKVLLKNPITQTSNQIIKYLDEVNSVQYGVSSEHIELCYLAIGGGGQQQQQYKIEICSPMSIVCLTNTLKRIQMTASTLSKNFGDLTFYYSPLSSDYDGYVSESGAVDGILIATLNSKLCDAQMTTLSSFQSNSFSTLCTQSGPIITSLSTNNGASIGGYQLSVNGYRFQSNLNVTVGGAKCSQTTFQTSQLVQCVVPPNTGINHLVSFSSNHIQSTPFYFSYNQPIINSVLVSDITRSVSEITINGANFGNSGSNGNDNALYISIDQYQCFNIIQHVDSTIRCRIKSRVAVNNFVNVSISNDNSNGIRQTSVFHLNQITNTQFNYSYVPNIVAVLPSHGFARDLVTVVGDSFANGDALPLSYFKDTRSTVLPPGDMGDDILTVRVPQITRDSQLLVSVDNIGSNLKSFTLDQPFIESISPSRVSSSGGVIIIKGGGWGMSRQAIDYVKLGSTPISCTPFNKFLECIVPPSTGEVNTLTVSFSGRVTTSYLSDYGMSYSTPRITSYTESSGVLTIRGVDFVNSGTSTSPQNSYLNVVSNMNRPISYQQLTFVNKTMITATLTSLLPGESVESVQVLIFGMKSNTYYHARYGCDGWVRNGDYNYIPLHYGVYPLKDYGFCVTPSCIASYQKSSGEAGCIIVVDSNTGVLTLSYEFTINLSTYVDAHIDGVFNNTFDTRGSEFTNSIMYILSYPTAASTLVTRRFYPSMSRIDCPSNCLINVSSTNASYIPIINNWRADFTVNKQPQSFDIGFYDKRIFGEPRSIFFDNTFGSGRSISLPYGRFRISFECQSYTISDPTNSINVAVYSPGIVNPTIYAPPGSNINQQATTFDVYRNGILNAYSGGLNSLGQAISFENIYHPRVPSYYIGTSLLVCSSIPPSNIWTCTVPPKTSSTPLTFSTYLMVGTTLTKLYKEFPITYTSVLVASGSVFMDYDKDNTFNNIDTKMAGHTVQIKSGSTVLASQNTVAGAIGFSFSMDYFPTNARIYIYPSPGYFSYIPSFPFSSPIVKDFPIAQSDYKKCQGFLTAGSEQLNLQFGTYDLSKFGWCKSPSVCANVITSQTFADHCTLVYSGTMVTIDYNAPVTLTFWHSNTPGQTYGVYANSPPPSVTQYVVLARSIMNGVYVVFNYAVPANGTLKFNVPYGTTNLVITTPSIFDHLVDGTTIDFTTSLTVPSYTKTLGVFSPATHYYNSASVNILSLPLGFYNFTWYSKQGQIKSFSAHPSMSIYVWNNAGTLYNVARNGNNIQLPDTLALTVENSPTDLYSFTVPPEGLQFRMPTPYTYVPFLFIEGLEIECENAYITCKIPSHIGGTTSKAKLKHTGTFFYHTWTITYQKRFEIPSAGSSYLAAGQSLTLGVNDLGVMIKYPLNPGVGQPYTYFSLSPTGIKIGFQAGPTNSHIYQVLSSQYDQSFTAPFSFKVESDYNIGLWGTKSGALSRGAWYLDKSPLPLQSSYLQVVRDGVIVQNSAGRVTWSRLKPLNYSGLARPLGAQIDYLDALDTNKNTLFKGQFLTNGESYLRVDTDGGIRLYNDNSFTTKVWEAKFTGGLIILTLAEKWVLTSTNLCAYGQSGIFLPVMLGCLNFYGQARYLFVAPPTYGSSQFSMTVTNYFGALVYSQGSAPTSPYKMIPGTFMEFGDALIHGQFLTNGVEKLYIKPNGVFRREASGSETTLASGVVNAIYASIPLQFSDLITVTPPGTYKYVFYPPPGHNLPNVDPVTKLVFVTAAGRGAGTSNPAAQFVIYDQKYWANI
ncbi:hypothetical protein DFA_02134 [Cavenderia fasciculata]|uniref:IPT/TIG domain-containing protein n=1 Tax=Cavenderia fasciculata TaxID=261658 RepID=F4PYT1_CACFS|nr:uncharacterized protein DFA_02134 [Cavenderia fasciculata]EGG19347.1 hypothetical protein DFA_02134 [Cavenderia fasciculata]|eukprot:XP_004357618.1 hypothetical protein DFA_02134 [Cavenderia fasciculata]